MSDINSIDLGIAVPVDWNYVHLDCFKSLMAMVKPSSWTFYDSPRGGDIAEKRNYQAKKALQDGKTHILYLDADMIFPMNTIPYLLEAMSQGADLAGIVSYRGYPPYEPLIWKKGVKGVAVPGTDYQFGDLVEAEATGCGCLMVDMKVFQALPEPWFQIREVEENGAVVRRGEDIHFTSTAVEAGYSLKIVTKVDTQHIREIGVDRHFWASFLLVNKIVSKHGWEGVFQAMKQFG